MSDQRNGGIAWTEQTWNPLRGCSRVSAGCMNCYAESMAARFCGPGQPYMGTINPQTKRWSGKIKLVPERLQEPLRWTRPRRVFVNSMSDLFHEDVPFEFIADVFAVMLCTTRHTYQVLTKRPARMLEFFKWLDEEHDGFGHPTRVDPGKIWPQWTPARGNRGGYDNCGPAWPPENVWLGVTIENQAAAYERIPLLLQAPAAVRWVSMEPLIGPVDLALLGTLPRTTHKNYTMVRDLLHWVVVGGESGPHARPMHADWARSLRDQCASACVPFLFKQWGEWADADNVTRDAMDKLWNGHSHYELREQGKIAAVPAKPYGPPHFGCNFTARIGKKAAGRLLDGVLHDEYPEVTP